MPTLVKGSDVILSVLDSSTYTPVSCSTNCSLDVATEAIETTTTGSGRNRTYTSGRNSITASVEGVTVLIDVGTAHWLLLQQLNGTLLSWRMVFTDEGGNSMTVTFDGIITQTSITAPAQEYSDFQMEIQVSGALTINGTTYGGGGGTTPGGTTPTTGILDESGNFMITEGGDSLIQQ